MSSVASLSFNRQRRSVGFGSVNSISAMPLNGPVFAPAGGDVSASVFDTVTVSEAPFGSTLILKTMLVPGSVLSDTVTLSESVANLLSHLVATSDTVTLSESVANLLTILPGLVSDTVTVSETSNLLLSHFAIAVDTVTVSEAFLVTVVHLAAVSDSVTVSDSGTITLNFTADLRITDTITISETVALLWSAFVNVSDTVTASETVGSALVFEVTTFDAVTLTELAANSIDIGVSVVDTITLTDRLTETLTWTIRTGATAIEGVKVWLSTADPFTASNLVRDSIKTTDSSGQVSYALDFDQIYYGWRDHPIYTFPDPWKFRYNTVAGTWQQHNGTAWVTWTP